MLPWHCFNFHEKNKSFLLCRQVSAEKDPHQQEYRHSLNFQEQKLYNNAASDDNVSTDIDLHNKGGEIFLHFHENKTVVVSYDSVSSNIDPQHKGC